MSVIKLLLAHRSWSCTSFGPQACCSILLTEAGFVLKPDIDMIVSNIDWGVKDRFQRELFYMRPGRLIVVWDAWSD